MIKKHLYYSFIAGALLPMSLAPLRLWPLAILSIAYFLYLLNTYSEGRKIGFAYGFGKFTVGISWIFHSLYIHSNTPLVAAVCLTALFVALLALYLQAFSWLWQRYFVKLAFTGRVLAAPALWVIMEWCVSTIFSGFPWVLVGYAHLESPLRGLAPIIGVYGLSAITVVMAVLVTEAYQQRRAPGKGRLCTVMLVLILACGWAGQQVTWTQPLTQKVSKVGMVQGNISPSGKYTLHNPEATVWHTYMIPTRKLWQHEDLDLVMWPESVVPIPLPDAEPFVARVEQEALTQNSSVLMGIYERDVDNKFYGTAMLLGAGDRQVYRKRQLVLFGEYIPLASYLRGTMALFDFPVSDVKEGPKEGQVFTLHQQRLLPLICYDIAYSTAVREMLIEHWPIHAITHMSEEGWFGDTWEPYQHLDMARMRALETGLPVLRVGGSGITAIINPDGAVVKQLPKLQPGYMTGEYQAFQGKTPWVTYGNMPLFLLSGSILVILLFIVKTTALAGILSQRYRFIQGYYAFAARLYQEQVA